jgi:serine/threonine protein kinase
MIAQLAGEKVSEDRTPFRTSIKDFQSLKVLGKGNYGKVMLVRHKESQRLFAMKVFKKAHLQSKNQIQHTITERRVLELVDHPFVVKLHYAFADDERLYLVLDYCCGGEMFFYLQKVTCFKEDVARFYSACLLCAVKALHELKIAYRE